MTTFYFTLVRRLNPQEVILTGERLTPECQIPARFRLDDRSRALTGSDEVEVLNLEIVEDSPPVNVFNARQVADKQAPVSKPKPPKPKPPVVLPEPTETQLEFDFTAPVSRFSEEERKTLRMLREHQRTLYGEQWLAWRQYQAIKGESQ